MHPGLTLVHPVTGFQVASVQAICVLSAISYRLLLWQHLPQRLDNGETGVSAIEICLSICAILKPELNPATANLYLVVLEHIPQELHDGADNVARYNAVGALSLLYPCFSNWVGY